MGRSEQILQSWKANAGNWIATIDHSEIESRNLVTNQAIVEKILEYKPQSLLDIGCGEGWLSRAMQSQGIKVLGVDAVKALVDNAVEKGGPFYKVADFSQLACGEAGIEERFDAVVINFALLDKDDTNTLLKSLVNYLSGDGRVFIQTLHPYTIAADGRYTSGWRDGSWTGLERDFEQPYQWYFRTLESWAEVFKESGLQIEAVKEPLHPQTQKPASVIFVLKSLSIQ